jgi:uncharacterized protein (DUF488 family)|tara:strand:- start:277 stop:801 length:525 start_codon:yes stop_codon:yes gene_type:complete
MKCQEIFTIGYGGLSQDEFITSLLQFKIECLVDIRELPISRKQGFAKTALKERLKAEGIEYHHFRMLGSPKIHRHEVRETRNYKKFFSAMDKHLTQSQAVEDINNVIDLSKSMRSCLMCYCPNWEKCHRKPVIEVIGNNIAVRFSHILNGQDHIELYHQDDFLKSSNTKSRRAA